LAPLGLLDLHAQLRVPLLHLLSPPLRALKQVHLKVIHLQQ
jgi:hypothetical protein